MRGGNLLQIHTYKWINTMTYAPVVKVCTVTSNTQKFHVLPIKCIYVFFMDLSKNSDYLWILFLYVKIRIMH